MVTASLTTPSPKRTAFKTRYLSAVIRVKTATVSVDAKTDAKRRHSAGSTHVSPVSGSLKCSFPHIKMMVRTVIATIVPRIPNPRIYEIYLMKFFFFKVYADAKTIGGSKKKKKAWLSN
jgi:hypothetical protein